MKTYKLKSDSGPITIGSLEKCRESLAELVKSFESKGIKATPWYANSDIVLVQNGSYATIIGIVQEEVIS